MPKEQNFRKNIYLAEDDEDDSILFLETVKGLYPEFTVSISQDGQQLLNNLNSAGESLPEILFLDINMPLKNGFDCLKEIRSRQNWSGIKIVMLSTSRSLIHIELAYKLGADYYAAKPHYFPEFKELMQSILVFDWNSASRKREDFVLTGGKADAV